MLEIDVPFVLRGAVGLVHVQIQSGAHLAGAPDSGAATGSDDDRDLAWFRRFPTCTATVSHPARGYDAISGWVQFVRSTDSDPDTYEMDPLPFTEDLELPYCWYGTRPILFDAPSRVSHQDLTWRSHSFLCAGPGVTIDRTVESLAGFSWGFDVIDGDIEFVAPQALSVDDWVAHFPVLSDKYPRWTFLPGHAGVTDLASMPGNGQHADADDAEGR